MTGDEIRETKFPKRFRGYDAFQVDGRLSLIADMIEAGRSPAAYISYISQEGLTRVLRGYDAAAVDRFLDALAGGGAPGYTQPMAPSSSRRVGDGEPALWDGSREHYRYHQAGRSWKQYLQEREAEWLGFSSRSGTHLRCIKSQIIASDGQVLMTYGGKMWTLGASGQQFRFVPGVEVVAAGTGDPILRVTGGVVRLSEPRWLWFPVRGTRLRNAVMTAVDDSGTEVLWFRSVGKGVVEVAVSRQHDVTPEILCVTAVAAPWLRAHFNQGGGGGG